MADEPRKEDTGEHPGLGMPIAGPFPFFDRYRMLWASAWIYKGIVGVETLFTTPGEGGFRPDGPKWSPLWNLEQILRRPTETVFLCQSPYTAQLMKDAGYLATAAAHRDPFQCDLTELRGRDVVVVHTHDNNPLRDWRYDVYDALLDADVGSIRQIPVFWEAADGHTIFDEEDPKAIIEATLAGPAIAERDPTLDELDAASYKSHYKPFAGLLEAPEEGKFLLPRDGLVILGADGGFGKSFFALRTAVAVGALEAGVRVDVIGQKVVSPGLGVYITAEDNITTVDDTIERMLGATDLDAETRDRVLHNVIRKPYGSLSSSPELVAFDQKSGTVRQLPEFAKLRRQLHLVSEKRKQRIAFIAIDNASQVFSIDSDKQFQVVKTIRVLQALAAEFDCLVMLLVHTRKAGQSNGAPAEMSVKALADNVMGSAGWKTGVRCMLAGYEEEIHPSKKITTIKSLGWKNATLNDEVVNLALVKSNLGPKMWKGHVMKLIKAQGEPDFVYIPADKVKGAHFRAEDEINANIREEIAKAHAAGAPHTRTTFETAKWENGQPSIADAMIAKMGQKERRARLANLMEASIVSVDPDFKAIKNALWAPTTVEMHKRLQEGGEV